MKSKEIKYQIERIYKIFCIPAIYAHEIAHAIACLILFIPILEIKVDYKADYSYVRFIRPNFQISNIIVNLAPFAIHIAFLALAFLHIAFLFCFIYFLLAYKVSLPSEQDYKNIREFNAYEQEIS